MSLRCLNATTKPPGAFHHAAGFLPAVRSALSTLCYESHAALKDGKHEALALLEALGAVAQPAFRFFASGSCSTLEQCPHDLQQVTNLMCSAVSKVLGGSSSRRNSSSNPLCICRPAAAGTGTIPASSSGQPSASGAANDLRCSCLRSAVGMVAQCQQVERLRSLGSAAAPNAATALKSCSPSYLVGAGYFNLLLQHAALAVHGLRVRSASAGAGPLADILHRITPQLSEYTSLAVSAAQVSAAQVAPRQGGTQQGGPPLQASLRAGGPAGHARRRVRRRGLPPAAGIPHPPWPAPALPGVPSQAAAAPDGAAAGACSVRRPGGQWWLAGAVSDDQVGSGGKPLRCLLHCTRRGQSRRIDASCCIRAGCCRWARLELISSTTTAVLARAATCRCWSACSSWTRRSSAFQTRRQVRQRRPAQRSTYTPGRRRLMAAWST